MTLPFALIIDEEKGLILLDRSAERRAKLIQIELLSLSLRNKLFASSLVLRKNSNTEP